MLSAKGETVIVDFGLSNTAKNGAQLLTACGSSHLTHTEREFCIARASAQAFCKVPGDFV